jgi:hypothetical protein
MGSTMRSGSSFAASFVTAAFALLHALLPRRTSDEIWAALVSRAGTWRAVVPRNLDGDAAFECLSQRERISPNDN